jgi:hypothetical protein
MLKKSLYLLLLLMLFTGCATIIPIDTSVVTYKSDEVQYQDFKKSEIAVLPVLAGDGYEGFRRVTADKITSALGKNLPNMKVLSQRETLNKLNEFNLSESYAKMMDDYSKTAILNRKTLNSIGNKLGCKYLLYSKVDTERSVEAFIVEGNVRSSKVIGVEIYAQLWDTNIGDLVWEGHGGSAAPENGYDVPNLIELSAEGLAKRISKSSFEVPAPEKASKIHSQQITNAYMPSLVISGLSLVFLLMML